MHAMPGNIRVQMFSQEIDNLMRQGEVAWHLNRWVRGEKRTRD